jgi:hypothetical protein
MPREGSFPPLRELRGDFILMPACPSFQGGATGDALPSLPGRTLLDKPGELCYNLLKK